MALSSMNQINRLIGFGVVVATSVSAIAPADLLNLQFSPKEGDNFNYKISGTLRMGTESPQFSGDIHYKVVKVALDRTYTVTFLQTNVIAILGGNRLNLPDSSSTTVNKENGDLLDYQSKDANSDAWRMAELRHFVYPSTKVKIGDEWTSIVLSDKRVGKVAATGNYKVDSLEQVGRRQTAKVRVTYKETEGMAPASSEGFVWIDTSDGSMVRTETTWMNAPTPQGPIGATITVERV